MVIFIFIPSICTKRAPFGPATPLLWANEELGVTEMEESFENVVLHLLKFMTSMIWEYQGSLEWTKVAVYAVDRLDAYYDKLSSRPTCTVFPFKDSRKSCKDTG